MASTSLGPQYLAFLFTSFIRVATSFCTSAQTSAKKNKRKSRDCIIWDFELSKSHFWYYNLVFVSGVEGSVGGQAAQCPVKGRAICVIFLSLSLHPFWAFFLQAIQTDQIIYETIESVYHNNNQVNCHDQNSLYKILKKKCKDWFKKFNKATFKS